MTSSKAHYRVIRLSRGKVALVSRQDYRRVSKYKWYAMFTKGKFYAVRKSPLIDGVRHQILMHRFILGLEFGDKRQGDHVNNKRTLDNRRSNIRIATHTQNTWNSAAKTYNKSGFKGVSIDLKAAAAHKWRARITVDRKQILLGSFRTRRLAHKAYTEAAKKHFGQFSRS